MLARKNNFGGFVFSIILLAAAIALIYVFVVRGEKNDQPTNKDQREVVRPE